MKNRPRIEATGSSVTTPMARTMTLLLGPGLTHEGVTLTRDETESLNRLYGFEKERPRERPPQPVRQPDPEGASPWERMKAAEAHEKAMALWKGWEDPAGFMQAGANRNLIRHAEHDGLRLIAWLARRGRRVGCGPGGCHLGGRGRVLERSTRGAHALGNALRRILWRHHVVKRIGTRRHLAFTLHCRMQMRSGRVTCRAMAFLRTSLLHGRGAWFLARVRISS